MELEKSTSEVHFGIFKDDSSNMEIPEVHILRRCKKHMDFKLQHLSSYVHNGGININDIRNETGWHT